MLIYHDIAPLLLGVADVTAGAGAPGAIAPLFSVESAIALLTLTALEIVLGIDNIIFIAILCARLPESQRKRARLIGLSLAMFMRIGLLLAIGWVTRLTAVLFTVLGHGFTGKDLVLLGGGLFLVAKATFEVHHKIEGAGEAPGATQKVAKFSSVIAQILLLDIVFSLDSVITAVGMADHIPIMIAAVVIAVGVMLVFAGPVSRFVDKHPTFKMLALCFLILIGVMLIAEGTGQHVSKGYIYTAMAFSLAVEGLNLWVRTRQLKHLPGGPGAVNH